MELESPSTPTRTGPAKETVATAEIYYMDARETDSLGPGPEAMYTYTPTITDLINRYTHIGNCHAQTLSHAFKTWNSLNDNDVLPETAWRSMNVGDIIVFDGDAYIIRPAGYAELDIVIPDQ